MSNLSEKRTKIVESLGKIFPNREVTMKQLMGWAENEGLSKYAPSFIWKNENKIRRGVYRIPDIGVRGTKVASVPKATKEDNMISMATNVIEFPTESYVPAKVSNYVKFGHYNDVKTIKKSKQLFTMYHGNLNPEKLDFHKSSLNIAELMKYLIHDCNISEKRVHTAIKKIQQSY